MKNSKTQSRAREYFRAFYRGNKLNFAAMLLTMMLVSLANPFFSWLLGAVTDSVAAGSMQQLTKTALVFLVVLPLFVAAIFLAYYTTARFVRKASSQYKELAFVHLSQKSISAFSKENTGRYLSMLTNDVNSIETQYLENIGNLVNACCTFIAVLAMMCYYNFFLAIVTIIGSVLPIVISVIMGGKYAVLEKQVSDCNESYTARIKDLLSGFAVLKSFKAEKQSHTLYHSANEQLETKKEQKRKYQAWISAAGNGAGIQLQIGVFVLGGYLALRGHITIGTVMIFVNLSGNLIGSVQTIPGYWAGIKAARELVKKLAELTEENAARSGDTITPVLKEAITLEDVSFGYEEGKTVLKDVNLTMKAGKKYAIVGASGSGKSTLLNLLMGGCEGYTGSIAIDGKELRTVDPDSLYDLMSLIGQNVFLFDNTIRENITMFRDFPNDAVESAVERSGLVSVIEAKGEHYRCGENGNGLSGGERQRVSIARSLLRNTPVLMLDEATAALDNQTAFEVTDAILKLDGLTRIVVTHRLEEALLRQYDEIFVLRDGKVAEQGTYESLMAKTGYFYSLYHVSN